jgi:uncharacterized protein (DUF4415 family)
MNRDEALQALVTIGKVSQDEARLWANKDWSLETGRFNAITDLVMDMMSGSGEFEQPKKKRGQRGKGKKEAASLVSIRIPNDVLSRIEHEAEIQGMTRTEKILSMLSKAY